MNEQSYQLRIKELEAQVQDLELQLSCLTDECSNETEVPSTPLPISQAVIENKFVVKSDKAALKPIKGKAASKQLKPFIDLSV